MTPLAALRQQIGQLLGGQPSLKRARQSQFLLVMFGPWEVAPLLNAGYTLIPLGENRWGVEPPQAFYELANSAPPPWQPGAAWQLYHLAAAHPADEDPAPLRALLKAWDSGEGEACCRDLISLCALRLRQKQPLPYGLAPWLEKLLTD